MQVFQPDFSPVEPHKVILNDNISLPSKIYPLDSLGKERATKVFHTTSLESEQNFSDDKIHDEELETAPGSTKTSL